MSRQEDRLLAGRAVVAKVLAADVKAVVDSAKADLESLLDADEGIAAELPDGTRVGSVKRSKPRKSAKVTDERALLAWVKEHRPDEVVESVNPAFVEALKAQAKTHGHAFDPESKEVIPGVEECVGAPSYLPQVGDGMDVLVRSRLAQLIASGALPLAIETEREAS